MGIDDLSRSAREVDELGYYSGVELQDSTSGTGGVPTTTEATGGMDVFYGINSNPLIAKISTDGKGIGWTNTRKTDWPNNGRSTPPTEPQNMWPYLAIYETAPVESNLDIYWETATSGLVVDLNTAVASTAGGAVAFDNFAWDWDESMSSGSRVTPAINGQAGFEPLTPSGEPYAAPCECVLLSVTNALGDTVSNMFSLVETSSGSGQFKILFIKDSQPFLSDSYSRDVYTFEIEVTTPDGAVDVVPIVGVPGGIGALKNIAPSFGAFPNDIDLDGNDTVILSPSDYVDVSNGAFGGGIGQFNTEQIKYSMEGINGTVIPGVGEGDWDINSATGEITCDPGATTQGTYELAIKIEDALGIDQGSADPDYDSLSATQNITVYLGYPAVNPGALSSSEYCTLDKDQTSIPIDNKLVQSGSGSVNGIWYVSETPTISFDLGTSGTYTSILAGGNAQVVHLGGDNFKAHETGTIAFDVNWQTDNDVQQMAALTGTLEFFYRRGGGAWSKLETELSQNREYNRTAIASWPTASEPIIANGAISSGSWIKVVRAYDRLDFPTPPGQANTDIDYCILIKNMAIVNSGSITAWVGSDDLHYPACIPYPELDVNEYVGINQADVETNKNKFAGFESNTGRPIYKYYRSFEKLNTKNAEPVDTSKILYAETPYTEYVNSFFTDVNLTDLYKPGNTVNQSINFSYAHDHEAQTGATALRWQNYDNINEKAKIKMVASFDDIGVKIKPTTEEHVLYAKQTTYLNTGEQAAGLFPPTRFYNKNL